MNNKILTTEVYWSSMRVCTKAYWINIATGCPHLVCTHRPSLKKYKGEVKTRRCSQGGRWGKSADVVGLDVDKLLENEYILQSY